MKFPAAALFERALRIESRSALISWARVLLLLILLFVLFPIQTMARYGWYGAPGLRFLQQMVWANFVLITLAGMSYFASAITEEKEEQTLGLLRMTNLSPVAILLGKSTSRLVGALLLLMVQIPFILLAVSLGGVGNVQIAAAYGTLLAYVFLLCNLALLFSVVLRNTATAAGLTLLSLIVFFWGHTWIGYWLRSVAMSNHVSLSSGIWPAVTTFLETWGRTTPINRLVGVFTTGFTGPAFEFQMISNIAIGIFFFLIAWLVFDRCTREEKDAAPGFRIRWRRTTSRRSRIPQGTVGSSALTWKDFTFVAGGKFGLLARSIVVLLLIALCNFISFKSDGRITREFEGGLLIWISLLATAVGLAFDASRVLKDEVRWKTLSSIAILPISIRELAYRKVIGTVAGTLPLLGFFVLGVLLIPDGFAKFMDETFKYPSILGGIIVGILQYILFLHLVVFLSLIIKRGALPLAIAIHYLGGAFLLGIFSAFMALASGGPGVMLFFIGLISVVGTFFLHIGIGYRLERAVAEE